MPSAFDIGRTNHYSQGKMTYTRAPLVVTVQGNMSTGLLTSRKWERNPKKKGEKGQQELGHRRQEAPGSSQEDERTANPSH
jgi:hypothetical protein